MVSGSPSVANILNAWSEIHEEATAWAPGRDVVQARVVGGAVLAGFVLGGDPRWSCPIPSCVVGGTARPGPGCQCSDADVVDRRVAGSGLPDRLPVGLVVVRCAQSITVAPL